VSESQVQNRPDLNSDRHQNESTQLQKGNEEHSSALIFTNDFN